MANELSFSYQSGKTTYVLIRNSIGQIWNGSSFVSYQTANYALYVISAVEQGSASAYYTATFPTTIAAGVYSIVAKNQSGGSAAETDATIAAGDYQWNGTATMPLSDVATSGQIGQMAPVRIARSSMITNFPLYLVSSADHVTPFTSGVISGQISKDGAAFGALQSGAFAEVGLGVFRTTLTSGDLNCATAALVFTGTGISGGTADARVMSIITQRVSGSL